jgi:hypothetical protein
MQADYASKQNTMTIFVANEIIDFLEKTDNGKLYTPHCCFEGFNHVMLAFKTGAIFNGKTLEPFLVTNCSVSQMLKTNRHLIGDDPLINDLLDELIVNCSHTEKTDDQYVITQSNSDQSFVHYSQGPMKHWPLSELDRYLQFLTIPNTIARVICDHYAENQRNQFDFINKLLGLLSAHDSDVLKPGFPEDLLCQQRDPKRFGTAYLTQIPSLLHAQKKRYFRHEHERMLCADRYRTGGSVPRTIRVKACFVGFSSSAYTTDKNEKACQAITPDELAVG